MSVRRNVLAAVAAAVVAVGGVTVATTATSTSAGSPSVTAPAMSVSAAGASAAGSARGAGGVGGVASADEILDFAAASSIGYVDTKSHRSRIKALQYLLNAWGAKLKVDGSYGPATTKAVKAFQKRKKLEQDGKAGPITLGKLTVKRRQGARDHVVSAIQTLLNYRGYSVKVDKSFGPGTLSAVKKFQTKAGLTSDGIVGANTWAQLFTYTGGGGGGTPGNCGSVNKGAPKSSTVYVGNNIRVHKCFEKNTRNMIAAAAKAGVTLKANSSWRDPAKQIQLRKQNCGTSHYAIYDMPSSQCNPHTARPGTSRHERGLAIDFSNAGAGGAVFRWLSNNASKYHFYNYKPENWHWSYDSH